MRKALKAAYKAARDDYATQSQDQGGNQHQYPRPQSQQYPSNPYYQQQQQQQLPGAFAPASRLSFSPPPLSPYLSPPATVTTTRPRSPSLSPPGVSPAYHPSQASPPGFNHAQPSPYLSPSPTGATTARSISPALPPRPSGYFAPSPNTVTDRSVSPVPPARQSIYPSYLDAKNEAGPIVPYATSQTDVLARSPPSAPSPKEVPPPSRATQPLAPQYVPEASDPPTVRKILCLDGGGVRGLSEVLLLQELMGRLSEERGFPEGTTIEPWQEFDMIGGTSTGGLLALMLGRLRMSLEECRTAYLDMSKRIFSPGRKSVNVAGRSWDFLQANGRFRAQPLIDVVQGLLVERGMSGHELLRDPNADSQSCLTFVCATSSYGNPTCIRSYRNRHAPRDELLPVCKVWEAARATSAASTFFDPIEIGELKQQFIDGAFIDNNPIEVADRESRDMFPGEDRLIVSLGTGVGVRKEMTGNLAKLAESLMKLVTATDLRNERFYEAHKDLARDHKLFRFSVSRGLNEVGLAEHESVREIAEHTLAYTHEVLVGEAFSNCAQALRSGGQRLHVIAGEELAAHLSKLEVSNVNGARCIPYNSEFYFCFNCVAAICRACRGAHDYDHADSLVKVELLRWQKIMKRHRPTQTCIQCLEERRARVSCKACDWNMCQSCFEEKTPREKHHQAHAEKHSQHREYVSINAPFGTIEPPKSRHCPCQTVPYAALHCDRCASVTALEQPLYWCRTCRLEFGQAQVLCSTCWETEELDHKQKHHFQIVTYHYDANQPDDLIEQDRIAWRCIDCNGQVIKVGAVAHHAHQNIGMFAGGARLEFHRQWVISSCPLVVSMNYDRPEPKNLVAGVKCNFCGFGLNYGDLLSLCLHSSCLWVFCSHCTQTGRHGHRHQPINYLRYQLKSSQVNINKISCDSCSEGKFLVLPAPPGCS